MNKIEVTLNGKKYPVTLTEAAVAYLLEYGAKQSLADSVAGIKAKTEAYNKDMLPTDRVSEEAYAEVLIAKRVKAIESGTVRTRESAGDPVERELRAIFAKAIGKPWTDLSPADKSAKIAKALAGDGSDAVKALVAEARRRVKASEKLAVDDLGL